jgi:acetaldehyde dehydrogenase (acetylating)
VSEGATGIVNRLKGDVMEKQSIAIVGLGKVGSAFLEELLGQSNHLVEIVAVVESGDTTGRALAHARGIKNLSIDELIGMGDGLDILFDLTEGNAVRQELRDKLRATGNRHTIIATENVAHMIWTLIANDANLPNVHANSSNDYPRGYA